MVYATAWLTIYVLVEDMSYIGVLNVIIVLFYLCSCSRPSFEIILSIAHRNRFLFTS